MCQFETASSRHLVGRLLPERSGALDVFCDAQSDGIAKGQRKLRVSVALFETRKEQEHENGEYEENEEH